MRYLLTLLLALTGVAFGQGSEINLLENPGGNLGTSRWTGATASPGVETTEVGKGASSISWDAAGADTLTSSASSLATNKIIQNRLCVMSAYYKGGDANLKMQAWDGTTVIKELVLETKAEWGSTGQVSFVCPSTGTLALRFEATADAAVIYLDQMFLGTRLPYVGTVVTDWKSYTPVGTPTWTSTVSSAKIRRIGDTAHIQVGIDLTGAPAGSMFYNISDVLPANLTIDETKLGQLDNDRTVIGNVVARDAGGSPDDYHGWVHYDASSNIIAFHAETAGTWGTANPFTWVSGDEFQFEIFVPIAEWSGTSLVFQPTADDMALTKWADFTMSLPSTFTNSTVLTSSYRRVGPNIEVKVDISGSASATITSGTHAIGDFLPSGLTVMTGANPPVGWCYMIDDSAGATANDFVAAWRTTGSNFQCNGKTSNQDTDSDVWGATVPFTFTVSDRFLVSFSVPITEWQDLGSVPAIGVEVAGDGVVGLAGPTEFIADPSGETCSTGCSACDVLNMKTVKIGDLYQISFRLFMTATGAGRVACDFDMQTSSSIISGLDWTGVSEGHGVCNDATANNFTSGGTGAMVSGSDERWDIVVQGPVDTTSRAYSCVATFIKAIP